MRPVDDDHATCVLELEIGNAKAERLRYAQAAADQQLHERAVDIGAGIEVALDLIKAQVIALDVSGRKALDSRRWVRGDEPSGEADGARAKRVIRGLRRELAGLHRLRGRGDEAAGLKPAR